MINTKHMLPHITTARNSVPSSKVNMLAAVAAAISGQKTMLFCDPESCEIVRFSPYQIRKWHTGSLFVVGIHHLDVGHGKQQSFALSRMWNLQETSAHFNKRNRFQLERRFHKSTLLFPAYEPVQTNQRGISDEKTMVSV